MTKSECIDYVEAHLEVRYAKENGAYRAGKKIFPEGSVNHSIGCAQPSEEVLFQMMDNSSAGWGVMAILGGFHKGEGHVIQALPANCRCWGVGTGKKGSWNNTRIQWEVCEPPGHTYAGGTMIAYNVEKNRPYFARMWKMLVCWNVYICDKFEFGPEDIADHAESCQAGMGSNHADMGQWLPKHGKSMDALRAEVAAILNGNSEEEANMTEEQIKAIVNEAIRADRESRRYATLADIPGVYRPSVQKLMNAGIMAGYDGGKDGSIATICDNTILVDETFCRLVTVLDRAGVFRALSSPSGG